MNRTEITCGHCYNMLTDVLKDANTDCSIRVCSLFAIPLSVLATLVDTIFGHLYDYPPSL